MAVDRVRAKRLDNGREVVVPISALLYWIEHDKCSASFAVMRRRPLRDDVPHIREYPGSRWCVRIEILERLDGGSGADPDGATARRALGTIIDPELPDPAPPPQTPPTRLALAFRSFLLNEPSPASVPTGRALDGQEI